MTVKRKAANGELAHSAHRGATRRRRPGRCEEAREAPGDVYIYQLGDHDPSGVGAWEDFTRKVTELAGGGFYDDDRPWLFFERLAVTPRQIMQMQLPTRPTRRSDPRAGRFTGQSVEVDAIRAPVLRQIVEDAITQHIDEDALAATREAERGERDILRRLAEGDFSAE